MAPFDDQNADFYISFGTNADRWADYIDRQLAEVEQRLVTHRREVEKTLGEPLPDPEVGDGGGGGEPGAEPSRLRRGVSAEVDRLTGVFSELRTAIETQLGSLGALEAPEVGEGGPGALGAAAQGLQTSFTALTAQAERLAGVFSTMASGAPRGPASGPPPPTAPPAQILEEDIRYATSLFESTQVLKHEIARLRDTRDEYQQVAREEAEGTSGSELDDPVSGAAIQLDELQAKLGDTAEAIATYEAMVPEPRTAELDPRSVKRRPGESYEEAEERTRFEIAEKELEQQRGQVLADLRAEEQALKAEIAAIEANTAERIKQGPSRVQATEEVYDPAQIERAYQQLMTLMPFEEAEEGGVEAFRQLPREEQLSRLDEAVTQVGVLFEQKAQDLGLSTEQLEQQIRQELAGAADSAQDLNQVAGRVTENLRQLADPRRIRPEPGEEPTAFRERVAARVQSIEAQRASLIGAGISPEEPETFDPEQYFRSIRENVNVLSSEQLDLVQDLQAAIAVPKGPERQQVWSRVQERLGVTPAELGARVQDLMRQFFPEGEVATEEGRERAARELVRLADESRLVSEAQAAVTRSAMDASAAFRRVVESVTLGRGEMPFRGDTSTYPGLLSSLREQLVPPLGGDVSAAQFAAQKAEEFLALPEVQQARLAEKIGQVMSRNMSQQGEVPFRLSPFEFDEAVAERLVGRLVQGSTVHEPPKGARGRPQLTRGKALSDDEWAILQSAEPFLAEFAQRRTRAHLGGAMQALVEDPYADPRMLRMPRGRDEGARAQRRTIQALTTATDAIDKSLEQLAGMTPAGRRQFMGELGLEGLAEQLGQVLPQIIEGREVRGRTRREYEEAEGREILGRYARGGVSQAQGEAALRREVIAQFGFDAEQLGLTGHERGRGPYFRRLNLQEFRPVQEELEPQALRRITAGAEALSPEELLTRVQEQIPSLAQLSDEMVAQIVQGTPDVSEMLTRIRDVAPSLGDLSEGAIREMVRDVRGAPDMRAALREHLPAMENLPNEVVDQLAESFGRRGQEINVAGIRRSIQEALPDIANLTDEAMQAITAPAEALSPEQLMRRVRGVVPKIDLGQFYEEIVDVDELERRRQSILGELKEIQQTRTDIERGRMPTPGHRPATKEALDIIQARGEPELEAREIRVGAAVSAVMPAELPFTELEQTQLQEISARREIIKEKLAEAEIAKAEAGISDEERQARVETLLNLRKLNTALIEETAQIHDAAKGRALQTPEAQARIAAAAGPLPGADEAVARLTARETELTDKLAALGRGEGVPTRRPHLLPRGGREEGAEFLGWEVDEEAQERAQVGAQLLAESERELEQQSRAAARDVERLSNELRELRESTTYLFRGGERARQPQYGPDFERFTRSSRPILERYEEISTELLPALRRQHSQAIGPRDERYQALVEQTREQARPFLERERTRLRRTPEYETTRLELGEKVAEGEVSGELDRKFTEILGGVLEADPEFQRLSQSATDASQRIRDLTSELQRLRSEHPQLETAGFVRDLEANRQTFERTVDVEDALTRARERQAAITSNLERVRETQAERGYTGIQPPRTIGVVREELEAAREQHRISVAEVEPYAHAERIATMQVEAGVPEEEIDLQGFKSLEALRHRIAELRPAADSAGTAVNRLEQELLELVGFDLAKLERSGVTKATLAGEEYTVRKTPLEESLARFRHGDRQVDLDIEALRRNYEAGLMYEQGLPLPGETTVRPGAEQKVEVLRRQGLTGADLHGLFEQQGGFESYLQFIMKHEEGHAVGIEGRREHTGLMTEEAIANEMEANVHAFRELGIEAREAGGALAQVVPEPGTAAPRTGLTGVATGQLPLKSTEELMEMFTGGGVAVEHPLLQQATEINDLFSQFFDLTEQFIRMPTEEDIEAQLAQPDITPGRERQLLEARDVREQTRQQLEETANVARESVATFLEARGVELPTRARRYMEGLRGGEEAPEAAPGAAPPEGPEGPEGPDGRLITVLTKLEAAISRLADCCAQMKALGAQRPQAAAGQPAVRRPVGPTDSPAGELSGLVVPELQELLGPTGTYNVTPQLDEEGVRQFTRDQTQFAESAVQELIDLGVGTGQAVTAAISETKAAYPGTEATAEQIKQLRELANEHRSLRVAERARQEQQQEVVRVQEHLADAQFRAQQVTSVLTDATQEQLEAYRKLKNVSPEVAATPEYQEELLGVESKTYGMVRDDLQAVGAAAGVRPSESLVADAMDLSPERAAQIQKNYQAAAISARGAVESEMSPLRQLISRMFGRNGVMSRMVQSTGTFIVRQFSGMLVFGTVNALQALGKQALETEQTFVRVEEALLQTGKRAQGVQDALQGIAVQTNVALHDTYSVMSNLVGVFESTEEALDATRLVNQLELISQGALNAREGYRSLSAVVGAFYEDFQERGMTDREAIQYVGDIATRLQDIRSVNIEDTIEGLARLSEPARQFGLEIEFISAALAQVIKATGQTGQAASEQLGRMFSALSDPKTRDILIDFEITDEATLAAGDYQSALESLFRTFEDLPTGRQNQIARALGGQRQFAQTIAFLRQGEDALEAWAEAQSARGAADQRAQQILATLRGQIGQLGKQVQVFAQNLLDLGLADILGLAVVSMNKLLSIINAMLQAFNNLKDASPFLEWTTRIGIMIGQFVLLKKLIQGALADTAIMTALRAWGTAGAGVAAGGAARAGAARAGAAASVLPIPVTPPSRARFVGAQVAAGAAGVAAPAAAVGAATRVKAASAMAASGLKFLWRTLSRGPGLLGVVTLAFGGLFDYITRDARNLRDRAIREYGMDRPAPETPQEKKYKQHRPVTEEAIEQTEADALGTRLRNAWGQFVDDVTSLDRNDPERFRGWFEPVTEVQPEFQDRFGRMRGEFEAIKNRGALRPEDRMELLQQFQAELLDPELKKSAGPLPVQWAQADLIIQDLLAEVQAYGEEQVRILNAMVDVTDLSVSQLQQWLDTYNLLSGMGRRGIQVAGAANVEALMSEIGGETGIVPGLQDRLLEIFSDPSLTQSERDARTMAELRSAQKQARERLLELEGDETGGTTEEKEAARAALHEYTQLIIQKDAENLENLIAEPEAAAEIAMATGDFSQAADFYVRAARETASQAEHASGAEKIRMMARAREQLFQAVEAALQEEALAVQLEIAQTRDPTVKARKELETATQRLKAYEAAPELVDAQAMKDAQIAQENAMQSFSDMIQQDAEAIIETRIAETRDPLVQASYQLEIAQAQLERARSEGMGTQAIEQAAQSLIQAERAFQDELNNIVSSRFALAQAIAGAGGLDVEVAYLRLEEARHLLARGREQGVGEAELNRLQAEAISAQAALRDTQFQEETSHIDFLLQMERISTNTAIEMLQGMLEQTNLTQKQREQLELKIKGLQDSISSQLASGFNIPTEIELPTAYEVRRSLAESGMRIDLSAYETPLIESTLGDLAGLAEDSMGNIISTIEEEFGKIPGITAANYDEMADAAREGARATVSATETELGRATAIVEGITSQLPEIQTSAWGEARRAAEAAVGTVNEAISGSLSSGVQDVIGIVSGYAQALVEGINPILEALGRTPISLQNRAVGGEFGGGVQEFAEGGLNIPGVERGEQQATIKGPNKVVQWAEPETGGEAFIPLSPAKRQRSLAIWERTGELLGALERNSNERLSFAQGGFREVDPVDDIPVDQVRYWLNQVEGADHTGGGYSTTGFGGVKPHVAMAGDYIAERFGVRDIGGVGQRPGPSDHPLGLALDFMVYDEKGKGDAIARYLADNAGHFGIKYLIWNEQFNSGAGWQNYTRYDAFPENDTLQHRDHVHASFDRLLGALGAAPQTQEDGGGFSQVGFLGIPGLELPQIPDTPEGLLGDVARLLMEYLEFAVLSFGGEQGLHEVSSDASTEELKNLARQMLAQRGWAAYWPAFDKLVQGESSWNPLAQNPTSTAFGLGQFLDATWATVGGTKTTDPSLQLEYMMRYIDGRYGNPENAYRTWQSRDPHWYASGGIFDEPNVIGVGESGPEAVIPLNQAGVDFLSRLMNMGQMPNTDASASAKALARELRVEQATTTNNPTQVINANVENSFSFTVTSEAQAQDIARAVSRSIEQSLSRSVSSFQTTPHLVGI